MPEEKKDFIKLINKCNALKSSINGFQKNQSSIDQAIQNLQTVSEANGVHHSYNVFQSCINLEKLLEKKLLKNDFLILFYAALFHDLSKSTNPGIKKQIEETLSEKDKFLYKDHGILACIFRSTRPLIPELLGHPFRANSAS